MANIITIEFEPCSPPPANGYRVGYRVYGSGDPYTIWPVNFMTSPAVINDDGANPDGTEYEGFIQGDCGDGDYGPEVPWDTGVCIPVTIDEGQSLADGQVGMPYHQVITFVGTGPFYLTDIFKPDWMTLTIIGNEVHLTGVPNEENYEVQVAFVINGCDNSSDVFTDEISIGPPSSGCIVVEVGLADTEGGTCSNNSTVYLKNPPDSVIGPGATIYLNCTFMNPVIGYNYIRDSNGTIYELNSSNGVVGAPTGNSC